MRYLAPVLFALATAGVPAQALAQTPAATTPSARALELSFNNGLVTLVARGVTVSEIMAEWARQGGSKVINAEKVASGLVAFEFHDVPESRVLQSVLRSAAGFIAAPRRAGGPVGASAIEQVMILATSRPSASSSAVTMPTTPVVYNEPPPQPNAPMPGSPDDDIPAVMRGGNTAPAQPVPTDRPTVGVGTSPTPGVVIAPTKPGSPVPPGTIIK